jgi:methyltransferase
MELKMPLSVMLFLALLLAVAALRIFELRISKRHQQRMTSRGAAKVKDPYFRWMAMFHTLVLIGAAAEVVFLRRPLLPALGEHWNVQVVDSTKLGFVASGPFRYVRHPNYAAVFVEMIALPLIHAAWITALAGAVAHIIVLSLRLSVEDPVLLSNPDYAATMGSKPRFLPGLF